MGAERRFSSCWCDSRRISAFGLILTAALSTDVHHVGAQQPDDAARPRVAAAVRGEGERATGFFTELVDVRVVSVEVFVSDRLGIAVTGLEQDDFELRVDGTPTEISNFYSQSGGVSRPIGGTTRTSPDDARPDSSFRSLQATQEEAARKAYAVILVDHSRLGANNRKRAFEALGEALDRLGDEDLIAVVGVEQTLRFYSDFLYDREAVKRILERAERVPPPSEINAVERRRIFGELARGTSGGIQARASLADKLLLQSRIQAYAADEYARSLSSLRQIELVLGTMAGIPGRKSLLYVGEGIPTRPGEGLFVEWRNRFGEGDPGDNLGLRRTDYNTDYTRAVGRYDLEVQVNRLAQAANRAGVTVYAVDAESDHGGLVRAAMTEQGATSETVTVVNENFREPLESLAKTTGGRLLRSSGKLGEHLVEAFSDFENFYSLGFTLPENWQAGSDHDIEVRVKGRNLVVRHRDDIGVPGPDEREAAATLAVLRYHTADNPLEVGVAAGGELVRREDGNGVLPVSISIPIARLELIPEDGMHAGSVSIYVSTKGSDGDTTQVQKIPFSLAIPEELIDRARGDSARYELPLVLRAGDLQIGIGVRDNVSGRFSAVRMDVQEYSSQL